MDTKPIKVLSLFSGIGGLDLGVTRALRGLGFAPGTIAYVEREAACCQVLASAMARGVLDEAPIWAGDIAELDFPAADLVIGGPPCQPASFAGPGLGLRDERWLWPAMRRAIEQSKASLAFLENVSALVVRDRGRLLRTILGDLAALGFDAEWCCFRAADVGAPHKKRDRLFLLAHANGQGEFQSFGPERKIGRRARDCPRWPAEPAVCRVADGLPHGHVYDRALGNAVIPEQARVAFVRLWKRMKDS